jgi:hypothetical protein
MTRPHALTLTRNCGVDKFLPPRMSCDVTKPLRCLGVMLARLVGRALGGAFFLLGKARGRKALHPQGEVLEGLIGRRGAVGRTGVPWFDEAGTNHVAVRLSRSLGLPAPRSDILSMALRIATQPNHFGDVLLATTGTGVLGRYVLLPGTPAWSTRLHIAVSLQNRGWPPAASSDSDPEQSATLRAGLLQADGTVAAIRDTGDNADDIPWS